MLHLIQEVVAVINQFALLYLEIKKTYNVGWTSVEWNSYQSDFNNISVTDEPERKLTES